MKLETHVTQNNADKYITALNLFDNFKEFRPRLLYMLVFQKV